jgi:hypothetical protein
MPYKELSDVLALTSSAAMATSIDDIAGLVRGFTLAEDATQDHGQEPLRSTRSHLAFLQEAILRLGQSANTIASQAQPVRSLADDANISGCLPIAEVCSLHEQIKKLTDITLNLRTTVDVLTEATERSVIIQLRSLGNQSAAVFGRPPIQKLLSHFDTKIKDIVREVLNKTSDQNVLWRAAEECYKQAISPSGSLHADDYFDPLEEACLEWPYDPDFESEEYYEHENRLDVDEDYAAAFQVKAKRRSEARRKDRQGWIDFWIRVLNNSPDGPVLFYPPASLHGVSLDMDTPQYLFRTFDVSSSGRNDESVIASMASTTGSQESSRIDILSLEKQRAAELLHMHLTKSCFDGEEQDNLMSWTSSLLFAIQYAIWRAHRGGRHSSEIKICVVDTSKFPMGQFIRDVSLLEAYRSTAERLGDLQLCFFDFRLNYNDFYNGEYLSQGAVNHSGRSCVFSLDQLIQAGLYQLYPEFEDIRGRDGWTNRVRGLRSDWSAEQRTTDQEIQLALKIGRNCFNQFELFDIASILLTFKNRKWSRLGHASE